MNKLTLDERIEPIRTYLSSEEASDKYINLAYARYMLAIIDELKTTNKGLRQGSADMVGKVNRQGVRIEELQTENARLEARWYDLEARTWKRRRGPG